MTVGENIKRIRKERGFTQKKLGELCGMNEVQIRRYELGKANPKIETVDKIASALGVSVLNIMEDLTTKQWETTSEYQRLDKSASALNGIVAILTDIYGKTESKDLEGKYASGHYYVIGEGENQFILYDSDIDALYKSTKASIPFLVEKMKDSRPEKEIIQEYLEELNVPIPDEKIPYKFK